MKKRAIILVFALVFTVIFIIASIITVMANSVKNDTLVLKQYGNNIALYKNEKLEEIYDDIDTRLLSDYDRYLLRKGIKIENYEHLKTILEDYDG